MKLLLRIFEQNEADFAVIVEQLWQKNLTKLQPKRRVKIKSNKF